MATINENDIIDIFTVVEELAMAVNARVLAARQHWVNDLYEWQCVLEQHIKNNAEQELIENAERGIKRAKKKIKEAGAKHLACLEFLSKQSRLDSVSRLAARPTSY